MQHALLVLQLVLVGELQGLFEVVDAEHVAVAERHFLGQHAHAEQQRLKGPEQPARKKDASDHATAEAQGVHAREDLGHDLAEEQQEEGEQDGDADELQPVGFSEIDKVTEDVVAEHDDGHVDEVVGNQDGGQGALAVVAQQLYVLVGSVVLGVELVQVAGRQAEERNLGTAGKTRQYQQQNRQSSCEQHSRGGWYDGHFVERS